MDSTEEKIRRKADALGVRVKELFIDYDRLRSGFVTYTQFERILNQLLGTNLSHAEIEDLCVKYDTKQSNSTVNYRLFLDTVNQRDIQPIETSFFPRTNQTTRGDVTREEGPYQSVQETLDKISVACHKQGIRISDALKDYDKLRSGVITKRQFETELTNAVQRAASLSAYEIKQLAEYYATLDGRCDYRSFVETIENAFNIPDLEKKPVAHVIRPPTGLLAKSLNAVLSPDEEEIVAACLNRISEQVRKYNFSLLPFFKDFDRSTANTRNISKLQFGRVLSTLGLMPTENEFRLLCTKFEDKTSGDVIYPIFCQCVEEDYIASKYETPDYVSNSSKQTSQERKESMQQQTNGTRGGGGQARVVEEVDLNKLLDRIGEHVVSNRMRVKDYFQDMDPLNSGLVTKSQFVRCLSTLGMSSLGKFNITSAQVAALLDAFADPSDPDHKVNWKRFEREVARRADQLTTTISSNRDLPTSDADECRAAVSNLKSLVDQRRLNCWGPFKDFDKLNHGYIKPRQFLQCLEYLSLKLPEHDLGVLEAHFTEPRHGFNYQRLLSLVQPAEKDPPKYAVFRDELERLNQKRQVESDTVTGSFADLQSILRALKTQVAQRRVSIYEWLRDHDKLNSGRIVAETFRRALNLCNFGLTPDEVDIIINHYRSIKDERMVEYKQFCEEIETAFGEKHLEKDPLVVSSQFEVKAHVFNRDLTQLEQDDARSALAKIAERVRAQRMQLFPKFKDFDRVNNGYVSSSQFERVLRDLNLLPLLTEAELKSLMRLFGSRVGSRDDLNYVSFADKVYETGSFEYRLP